MGCTHIITRSEETFKMNKWCIYNLKADLHRQVKQIPSEQEWFLNSKPKWQVEGMSAVQLSAAS